MHNDNHFEDFGRRFQELRTRFEEAREATLDGAPADFIRRRDAAAREFTQRRDSSHAAFAEEGTEAQERFKQFQDGWSQRLSGNTQEGAGLAQRYQRTERELHGAPNKDLLARGLGALLRNEEE